ncbi:MAG: UDP-N-acetylmuramate--L-alanine ligase [Alphaproteobacteria bacterium]|jgi:UDP-N-acetylmuramate--alanine ligase|nr:UDP-N-acetylmuramate--L-alanine ligase [Alphaproteobacteria bacterium]
MRTLPLDIGVIHFVGIGGIGMSGIAEVMHNLGYRVQGSDQAEGANVARLRGLGIEAKIGHAAENLGAARVVVISSAVQPGNPEVLAAREAMIPVVRRAEMLAELMRLKWAIAVGGTHGKTTTTSMIAAILDQADYDPTVINGGIINAYGTNARLGAGDWVVVEADESDGSFTKLPATIAVVTNMDPEHLDFYGDFEAERAAYKSFIENIPFYGFAVMCLDHTEVQALIGRISDRRVVTYGFSPQAAVRAVDVVAGPAGMRFDVVLTDSASNETRLVQGFHLPMHGEHNVSNALAAIAVGREMKIADDVLLSALAGFAGVKRRFTKTGEVGGVSVIDDYGHHPVEIAAALQAARAASDGHVIAVVQPHRFTRLRDLFEEFCTCFNDADAVVVAHVHAAGEEEIEGIDRDALVQGLTARGHRRVLALDKPEDLAALIAPHARAGDMVVCLGAGTITAWANALPAQLAPLLAAPKALGGAQ